MFTMPSCNELNLEDKREINYTGLILLSVADGIPDK